MEGAVSGVDIALVQLGCRTSDRAEGPIGAARALAEALGDRLATEPRFVGSGASASERGWSEDLEASRGCLLEAGGQVDDALEAGRAPLLVASDCAVGLTTLPAVARQRPEARVLWLDAHGDANTPETTSSGFLGGMALAGACGLWDPGLGTGHIEPGRVVLAGVRDLEPAERDLLEASEVTVVGASLETLVFTQNALDRSSVYVHVDLDVLDPAAYPAWMPAASGLGPHKLYDLLEAVASECEVVGVEAVPTAAPADEAEAEEAVEVAVEALDPLVRALAREGAAVGD